MVDETAKRAAPELREEFFENEATDVEQEDVGENSAASKPWDPARIRISTKAFSLQQVMLMIESGDIDLAPDFQRFFVWKALQRSRLIESILLGIPLPAFYFNQDPAGVMQVVDGLQRLTTVRRFFKGEALKNLEYLKQFEGCTFDSLDAALRRRFNQTQIFVNVIEPQTPDEVKFDVFRRINTGGSPLTAQEIRHCMSKAPSRDLLKCLIALPSFRQATGEALKNEKRMADRELALRFCAFRSLANLEEYRTFVSLDAFLLNFTRRVDGNSRMDGSRPGVSPLTVADVDRLADDFDRAMKNAVAVFGNRAFRKYFVGWGRGPINRALFDSWAVALADYQTADLEPHKDSIVKAVQERMGTDDYSASITWGTGDFSSIRLRFQVAREILQNHVSTEAGR